ncbi:hypothetical protein FTX61_10240 [Nitriliruptoraceae bacterium ZYF776]|nr:hypothetical protein [Profundirhabdus halotolerans]
MSATSVAVEQVTTAVSRQRLLVRVRWLALAFGVAQVLAYDMQTYPDGVREAALATLVAFAVANVALAVATRRVGDVAGARQLALASLVVDGVVVLVFVYLYSFDPLSAMFALLFLVPIEGAVHFGLPGAVWSWVAVAVGYTGREVFAVRFDNPFELTSLTYRVGLVGIVALTVGLLTRQLARESERSRRALAELRRIELWRTRLLGMLGHDLRSPLAAVQGLAATVAASAETLPPAEIRDLARRIVGQSNRLLALSADLLELARQEEDTLVLQRRDVRLAELAEHASDTVGYAETTTIDLPPDLVARVDPDRFAQVVGNLVANAHRHGRTPVEVGGHRSDGEVVLRVRDHGDGISASQRERLFDPFAHGAAEGSVGLGLWIVRAVVDAHGGTVTYEDAAPGARFTVRLPDVTS